MIWLAWRQFRTQALTVAAVLLVFLAALAMTWAQVTRPARETGFTGCRGDACDAAAEAFLNRVTNETAGLIYNVGTGVLLVLPVLLGIFWGAPLVARELETGTYRMIFSQSVSRRWWLQAKLAVGGVAAALFAGVVSMVLTWWAAPIDQAGTSRVSPLIFATRGIVPIGYAALGFVVGVIAGQVLRRTLTAMTVTLLVVAVLQGAVPLALVPVLTPRDISVTPLNVDGKLYLAGDPLTQEVHLEAGADIPGAWILSRTTLDSSGAEFKGPVDTTRCEIPPTGPPSDVCRAWLATQHLSQKVTYVPGSSFWVLQWRMFVVLIVLTLGLSWFSLWWIRRRLA